MSHRRPCGCAIAVTCLTVGSVIADPARDRNPQTPVRPKVARLVAAEAGELRDRAEEGSVATGSGPRVRIKPVAILGGGGSIVGDTAIIPGYPTLIKFEGYYGGWGSSGFPLRTFGIALDPASFVNGVGVPLDRAHTPCASDADCRAAYSSLGTPGDLVCNDFFPGECNMMYLETTRADFISGFEIPGCNSLNYFCTAADIQELGTPDDGTEKYGLTAVLSVPTGAAGTYEIKINELADSGTLLQIADPGHSVLSIGKFIPAFVVIPNGSCCFNPGYPNAGCEDNVTEAECWAGHAGTVIFRVGATCPQNGGPECCTCSQLGFPDPTCNDNDACTVDICLIDCTGCSHTVTPPVQPGQCCNPQNNQRASLDDGNVCTVDTCSVGGDRGVPQHAAASGATCDDGQRCTFHDACQNGTCVGTDIYDADISCSTHELCVNATGSTDAFCFFGRCDCRACDYPGSADPLCDDGDPCTYDRCNLNGLCEHPTQPSPGDPPTRACCQVDGTCEDLQAACCQARGGAVRVAGSSCLGDEDGDGTDDVCSPIIPAASEWGLLVLALSLLAMTKVWFGIKRTDRAEIPASV